MNILAKIRSILRLGRVTISGGNDGNYPIQQIEYLGKVGKAVFWYPYGMSANVPPDYLTILATMDGNPENRIALPTSFLQRPKDLAEGEFVLFHPPTGTEIRFKANQDLEIKTGTKVLVTSPESEITGNVTIGGNLQVDGDIVADGEVTAGTPGVTLTGHTHVENGGSGPTDSGVG